MACIKLFRFEQAEDDCCRALQFTELSEKDKVCGGEEGRGGTALLGYLGGGHFPSSAGRTRCGKG